MWSMFLFFSGFYAQFTFLLNLFVTHFFYHELPINSNTEFELNNSSEILKSELEQYQHQPHVLWISPY